MYPLTSTVKGCSKKLLTSAPRIIQPASVTYHGSFLSKLQDPQMKLLGHGSKMDFHTLSRLNSLYMPNNGNSIQSVTTVSQQIQCLFARTFCQKFWPSWSVKDIRKLCLGARLNEPVSHLIKRDFHPNSNQGMEQELSREQMQDIIGRLQQQQEASQAQSTLLIKLANENGYLSWCRNAYIAALAGYTIMLPYGSDGGLTFFVIGLLNMLIGSVIFIRNDIRQRRLQMRGGLGLVPIAMALLHILLYLFVITSAVHFTDEKGEEEDTDKEYLIEIRDKRKD